MKRIAAVLVGIAMMFLPGSALAQSSTCQAYNPQQCNTSGGTETSTSSTETPASGVEATTSGAASSGTLPFTGLDIGLLTVCGGLLIAGGGVVRSRVKRLD